ncbi:dynamin family GTPase [Bacillus sp. V3B]|uniref:dynamin family protein n=1 Tax=Bacillus sp. V3B TaxID=2804915 RepID=UPI00210EA2A7|nr:dynamin family protein [Bacillus sp. V3B]MCQ6273950.1 dynamin family GTPase [Bacillus sp. V3B]
MVKIGIQQETVLLSGQIAALYEKFYQQENVQSAERAKDLAIKLERQEYSIAFCGHFSAGKSSMINQLMGENILPSSPIPTSANLVKIKSGDDYAKVFFKEDRPRLYPAPYDYEAVKSYCKDGDQIQSIEISYSKTLIPKDTIIMDTPGIDSTDDAHRIATESALHLADLVFYVMDYNHVQSELNFLFTKELTEAGKDVYLVINQIDKHRDEELSFTEFQESVKNSFASWGVKPAKIFYTSLKKLDHPYNQFAILRQFMEEKVGDRLHALPESIFQSLKKLVEEHRTFLASKDEEEINKRNQILAELSEEEKRSLPETVAEITTRLDELHGLLKRKEKSMYDEIDRVLDNAYLMPFQTRDLAEQYLAARQPDFKVGLFFSKQKTEQERQSRLDQFYTDFAEKVTSQIDWHMKELLIKMLRESEVEDAQLLEDVQSFQVHFDKELLVNTVKTGARLSGDYVLNYTKDVVDAIKRIAKDQLAPHLSAFFNHLKGKQIEKQQKLEKELSRLNVYLTAFKEIAEFEEKQTIVNIQLEQIVTGHINVEALQDQAIKLAIDETEEAEVIVTSVEENVKAGEKVASNRSARPVVENDQKNHLELDRLIPSLRFASDQVKSVPGFKKIAEELKQKAERLENQSFTVALFGAFSAGKSSFANALIGDKLLPVSPNPTTAAINKIMPVDSEHHHGTVLVKLKGYDTLMEDVNRSLAAFEMKANTLDDAVSFAQHVIGNRSNVDAFEKTHLAFLQAFVRGIDTYRNTLGETIHTNLTEFSGFVANEEQSCLVEWIEVYYDCQLTRKGITLVDTPGADSINARHTGVAFEYIKNSDAILFVTYYNHAFSKADREFLIQLGRVKDTFALDKMFFIVNAIDLAQDEEEMNAVLDYVEDQLVTYGIRQPHLYPVSSLQAIKEKLESGLTTTSGIGQFEERFYSFIEHDLMEIAVNSAKLEWQRVLSQLQSFIHSAEADQETKAKKRVLLEEEKEQLIEHIQNQPSTILRQRLEQETDELVFYIKQRVFLRFSDFLKEAFNPALLKDDGRNLKKALQSALDGFLGDFGYDFAQELRATTLRIEAFIIKLLAQTDQSIITALQEHNAELSFSPYEAGKPTSIDFQTAFVTLDQQRFKKALSYFKNPKTFFEKNERKLLSDELEVNLEQPAEDYLLEGKERLKQHYGEQLEAHFSLLLARLTEQVEEYYQGALASISNELPIEELKKIEENLVLATEKGQN